MPLTNLSNLSILVFVHCFIKPYVFIFLTFQFTNFTVSAGELLDYKWISNMFPILWYTSCQFQLISQLRLTGQLMAHRRTLSWYHIQFLVIWGYLRYCIKYFIFYDFQETVRIRNNISLMSAVLRRTGMSFC